ncbi:MAG: MBL fold metallo-hydrolase [Burkholderiaceae bacterium]|nr:MBL fold metallo-hydrolase [Burkholderiaceae bacterium]
MRLRNLGSGSTGNSTLVEASQGITTTRVLVDCGFSLRELERRLQWAGTTAAELDGVFITHEHGDHVGCAFTLARKHGVPVFISRGTWRAVDEPELPKGKLFFAQDGQAIVLGDLELQPYAVPHDAQEPLQLICSDGLSRLGILTDAGSITTQMQGLLQGLDALLLEFNHDLEMLRHSSYPAGLKKRIAGTHGHLSNDSAAELLAACKHADLQHVVAAHLSERNNRPALVRELMGRVLGLPPAGLAVADPKLGLDWLQIE